MKSSHASADAADVSTAFSGRNMTVIRLSCKPAVISRRLGGFFGGLAEQRAG